MDSADAKSAPQSMRFRAKVESGIVPQDYSATRTWTAVRVPFKPEEIWPRRRGRSVRGTINGVAFRTTLLGSKANGYLLFINKTMQKQTGARAGMMAEVVVEPDLEDHSAKPPVELARLFKQDREVKKWFDKLNYSTRRYICDAVEERKSPESREQCAEHWMECLMLAMDGETVIPPLLQKAFRRYPGASEGWGSMTPIQRRTHLIMAFQAQSPEARTKRADRIASEAARRIKPKSGGLVSKERDSKEESFTFDEE